MSNRFLNNILNLIVEYDEDENEEEIQEIQELNNSEFSEFNEFGSSRNRTSYHEFFLDYHMNYIEELILRSVENESLENSQIKKTDSVLNSKYHSQIVKSDFKETCTICMEFYNSKDSVLELDCKHCLHLNCCQEWVKYKAECTVCRHKIEVEEITVG